MKVKMSGSRMYTNPPNKGVPEITSRWGLDFKGEGVYK